MNTRSSLEFLSQERVDQAANMANLLNDDDVAFLKNLSDSAAVSIAFIYSDGHWLLERHDGNQWLHDDLEQNRVARSAAENVSR